MIGKSRNKDKKDKIDRRISEKDVKKPSLEYELENSEKNKETFWVFSLCQQKNSKKRGKEQGKQKAKVSATDWNGKNRKRACPLFSIPWTRDRTDTPISSQLYSQENKAKLAFG